MNKLNCLQNMGFKISWKLISIGYFGYDDIPPLLNQKDVLEFLEDVLTNIDDQTENIIALICENNPRKFDSILKMLASEDVLDVTIQKRKWRVYLLKTIIDNISKDHLQGLLELMEFWTSMGSVADCPQVFPDNDKSVQDYFTQASYEINVNNNRLWLRKEIAAIVNLETNIHTGHLGAYDPADL